MSSPGARSATIRRFRLRRPQFAAGVVPEHVVHPGLLGAGGCEAPAPGRTHMKLHANAALSLKGSARMVDAVLAQDRSIAQAAEAGGVSERTCAKWVARYRSDGPAGLRDRSSAPRRVHNRTDPRL